MHSEPSKPHVTYGKSIFLPGLLGIVLLSACSKPFNPAIDTFQIKQGETISIRQPNSAQSVSFVAPLVDVEAGRYTAEFFVNGEQQERPYLNYLIDRARPLGATVGMPHPCQTLPQGRPFEVRALIYNEAGTLLHDLSGNVVLTCTR